MRKRCWKTRGVQGPVSPVPSPGSARWCLIPRDRATSSDGLICRSAGGAFGILQHRSRLSKSPDVRTFRWDPLHSTKASRHLQPRLVAIADRSAGRYIGAVKGWSRGPAFDTPTRSQGLLACTEACRGLGCHQICSCSGDFCVEQSRWGAISLCVLSKFSLLLPFPGELVSL